MQRDRAARLASQMSKRAGFQAATNLLATTNVQAWEFVEEHLDELIDSIPDLRKHHEGLCALVASISNAAADGTGISKRDLEQIVSWKHRVGKNRAFNVKHIQANTESAIETHARSAITLARGIDTNKTINADGTLNDDGRSAIHAALVEFCELKGVGPATASALLVLVRPDICCFMYDEAIDVFEAKRDYSLNQYLRVNSSCLQMAKKLGPEWSTSRVARAFWITARYFAIHGQDLTLSDEAGAADEPEAPQRQVPVDAAWSRKRRRVEK